MKLLLILIAIGLIFWSIYRILFTDRYVRKYKMFNVGDKVKCIYGRFDGCHGIVSYFKPEDHEDKFCMRVDPDVGERVNPDNWVKYD